MSSRELPQPLEHNCGAYPPSSKAYGEQMEAGAQGIRVVTLSEQAENSAKNKHRSDSVERPRTSQQSQARSADIDLPAIQEYVSQLPEALVPEFAMLLAQRMKQQIRNSDKLSQEAVARARAGSSPGGRRASGELAAHPMGRTGGSDSATATRYIVTTHLSYADTSIKHRVGTPEIIPYIPPGLYREGAEGRMELESSFRSSGRGPMEEGPADNGVVNVASTAPQSRLRKMMSKVFQRQTR